jgi:deazaflavin-dependent oxidoreductase (nitroreductase family)
MTNPRNDDPRSRNQKVIDEFRANAGRVDGPWTIPLLLITTTGAKTGRPFTTPVGYARDGDRLLIFASKGGAPENPDWYRNLVAHPQVTLEVGSEKYRARAEVVTGAERDRLYAEQVQRAPVFGDYEKRTSRKIPVVALTRTE